MPPKSKTHFLCQECGEDFPRWSGRCSACGQWNTLVETKIPDAPKGGSPRGAFRLATAEGSKPIPLSKVNSGAEIRASTGINEFDRILGGGLVAGAITLIGGEPGIGKSTLLLQVAQRLASAEKPSLYVSGEESLEQIRLRAGRLAAVSDHVLCLSETCVETITGHIQAIQPSCVIVDSIQTTYSEQGSGAPGSVSQIRDSAAHLLALGKASHIPMFLVGHLTKSGVVAGPRILEHMVDTVLYFEGDRHHNFRILRAVKNRFGSTNEIGIFEMTRDGLAEVSNPSELMLQERPDGASGSVVLPVLEGTRPLMVEIQALTSPNGGFGSPRRSASGIDIRRMNLLIAVLEKRLGLRLFDQDVHVNIAGGVKVDEPAADLAALCAIVSSFKSAPIDQHTIVLGEVGLAGEIRSVSHFEKRLSEAARLGFKRVIAASWNKKKIATDIRIIGVKNIADALKAVEVL